MPSMRLENISPIPNRTNSTDDVFRLGDREINRNSKRKPNNSPATWEKLASPSTTEQRSDCLSLGNKGIRTSLGPSIHWRQSAIIRHPIGPNTLNLINMILLISCWVLILGYVTRLVDGEYYLCNVCQNSDDGERYLYDRSESFINPYTNDKWTCGDLQDAVQDVDPTSNGAAGEAYLCTVYQIYAEMHCTCVGPDVPSILDGPYKDVNPSCDLCRGYSMSYVPTFRSKQTVDTGTYGTQNCLGLYEAALNGNVLSSEACQEVHDVYEDCCKLPDLPGESHDSSTEVTEDDPSPVTASSAQSKMSWACVLLLLIVSLTMDYY